MLSSHERGAAGEARSAGPPSDGSGRSGDSGATQQVVAAPAGREGKRTWWEELAAFLDGRKTYVVAGLAIGYLIGADVGWWPLNETVLTILGFGGLAALRAGVRKGPN